MRLNLGKLSKMIHFRVTFEACIFGGICGCIKNCLKPRIKQSNPDELVQFIDTHGISFRINGLPCFAPRRDRIHCKNQNLKMSKFDRSLGDLPTFHANPLESQPLSIEFNWTTDKRGGGTDNNSALL